MPIHWKVRECLPLLLSNNSAEGDIFLASASDPTLGMATNLMRFDSGIQATWQMLVNDIPTLWREVHPGSNAPLLAEALTTVQGMFGRKNMQRYFHQLQVLRDVRAVHL